MTALVWGQIAAFGLAAGYAIVTTELERHRTQRQNTYTAHRADIRLFDQDEEPAA